MGTTTTISLSTIGVLTGITLCILKACNVLNISWFWATFPFWIVPSVGLTIFIIVFIVTLILELTSRKRR